MASIPHELIRDVKIRARAAAGLIDYDPTLPNLPSLSAEVATLDPSPTDFRCESCRGRLLRGSDSLICVYCGRVPRKDVVREPVSFSGTVGYTWLLRSLGLDGSELVEPQKTKTAQDKGQSSPSSPMPLSEFLNFNIHWPAETGNQETSDTDKHLGHSPLSFTGVALDNFFVKSQVEAVLSDTSTEQKSTRNHIETVLDKDVHTLDSHIVSLCARSFEAAKSSLEYESGEAQWEADFQFAEGNTFPDSQQLKPSVDTEQLRSDKENAIPDIPNEQEVIHEHVGTSGNEDIAARDGHYLFQHVQSYEDVGSSTKEEASEAFSEWDADFQSAALDNMDGTFKSSDDVARSLTCSENIYQDSHPFNHFTSLEDNFGAHIDSVLEPVKDLEYGKVKDTPEASAGFDDWKSDDLWKNMSSKDSGTVGEFDASTSTKNDIAEPDHTYRDSHDSPATSDFFEDFPWQNKESVIKSNNEEVEKTNEDLVEGWGNVTELGSFEVSSVAKIADIEDVKMKDEDSFDDWGGFASSSLQTSDEINGVDSKVNKTENREHEAMGDDLFDEWGNFGSFNISSGTKNVGVTEMMTTTEKHEQINEEPLEKWGDFTIPASFQVPSETKNSNITTYHEEKDEEHAIADDDLFEGWGNFTSSTSMKISSEAKSADTAEFKTKEEPMKMDDDLFEGWGDFSSSANLQASSEAKSTDMPETSKKIEENKKSNDDYTFEGWGDFNKPNNGEPNKPVDDDDPFQEWSGFTGSKNLQVSNQIKLDQLDKEASTSDHRSSGMDFFNWGIELQGTGFDGFSQPTSTDQSSSVLTEDKAALSENSTADWFGGTNSPLFDPTKGTKPADSSENSNQDKEDLMSLMSKMHDLSFMLAEELRIPSNSNSSSKR